MEKNKKNKKKIGEKRDAKKKTAYRLLLMPIEWKANTAKLCALQTCLRFVPFNDFHDTSRKERTSAHRIAHLLVCHYLNSN